MCIRDRCVYELATGKKSYVAEAFDSNVDDYCWNTDSKTLYFIGCWHATVNGTRLSSFYS